MNYQIKPHCIGLNQVERIDIETINNWINKKMLYFKLWGFKPDDMQDNNIKKEIENAHKRMFEWAKTQCSPSISYGIFPCQTDKDMIMIYKKKDSCENCVACNLLSTSADNVLKVLFFERDQEHNISICDYFNTVNSGVIDFLGCQVVTLGDKPVQFAKQLNDENQYQDYFYWHGYCSALTEALAAFTHGKIRKEMGIAKENETIEDEWTMNYRSRRYSFGYSWSTDMSEQFKVLDILKAKDMGIIMNESDELEPEFSTCALVIHHPEAKYW
ncbi:MAG TPA: vitamin B12 dependent-methionine synthase activation domain-containing protein [Candidatus Cloacimonadota bacterium]|jgi:5-methyltetrahydrofolate--homocysteine methyltransferase|nr:vitamin B12 dependent-methionine synthase activation domain-containing protein [Candidatus Cloacimonadales bacterium]HPY96228.1 vitamin B12 dependent-methionine synthase activation domain-containing protein [Candidatus Cloacimonadota bacterium]HQB41440.1 vitamin B12 dependent-methionine synthase activation domain-containing protein [Candidatus Cloacimonadota bacterium]